MTGDDKVEMVITLRLSENKELILTESEARQLHARLNELFGKTSPAPVYPPPMYDWYKVTCENGPQLSLFGEQPDG